MSVGLSELFNTTDVLCYDAGMQQLDVQNCKVHVLVCTNERPAPKTACNNFGGMEFFTKFKQRLKDSGLIGTHWVTRTGCLGFCNDYGTVVVIRRKDQADKWYSEVKPDDFETIWNEATAP